MSAAAVPQGAEAQQVQYVMQAPQQGVVYAAAPQPVAFVGASGAFPMAQPAGQVMYIQGDGQQVLAEGQQIQYIQGDGQQVMEGQEMAGAPSELAGQFTYAAPEGMEGQQLVYGSPMVVAAPARVNVSHEVFAKLAAGGSLTPEEMAQLSGQPAPAPIVPGSPHGAAVTVGAAGGPAGVVPGSAKASGKKDKKDKKDKSGSKKALKASKKKKEKGCC